MTTSRCLRRRNRFDHLQEGSCSPEDDALFRKAAVLVEDGERRGRVVDLHVPEADSARLDVGRIVESAPQLLFLAFRGVADDDLDSRQAIPLGELDLEKVS